MATLSTNLNQFFPGRLEGGLTQVILCYCASMVIIVFILQLNWFQMNDRLLHGIRELSKAKKMFECVEKESEVVANNDESVDQKEDQTTEPEVCVSSVSSTTISAITSTPRPSASIQLKKLFQCGSIDEPRELPNIEEVASSSAALAVIEPPAKKIKLVEGKTVVDKASRALNLVDEAVPDREVAEDRVKNWTAAHFGHIPKSDADIEFNSASTGVESPEQICEASLPGSLSPAWKAIPDVYSFDSDEISEEDKHYTLTFRGAQ